MVRLLDEDTRNLHKFLTGVWYSHKYTYIIHVTKKTLMQAQTYHSRPNYMQILENKRSVEPGYPLATMDLVDGRLNLHDHLVKKPASTYFSQMKGDEAQSLGIYSGDLLVIDRSLAPRHRSLVMVTIDGEYIVCRLINESQRWVLQKGNGIRIPMDFEKDSEIEILGSITHVIHSCV